MLVFGGITTAQNYDNDVWALSLDGPATWRRIVVPGPAPRGRQSPAVVYDAERARLIVHGGYDGTNLIRDAWELSLASEPAWRELEPAERPDLLVRSHGGVGCSQTAHGDLRRFRLAEPRVGRGRLGPLHRGACAGGVASRSDGNAAGLAIAADDASASWSVERAHPAARTRACGGRGANGDGSNRIRAGSCRRHGRGIEYGSRRVCRLPIRRLFPDAYARGAIGHDQGREHPLAELHCVPGPFAAGLEIGGGGSSAAGCGSAEETGVPSGI